MTDERGVPDVMRNFSRFLKWLNARVAKGVMADPATTRLNGGADRISKSLHSYGENTKPYLETLREIFEVYWDTKDIGAMNLSPLRWHKHALERFVKEFEETYRYADVVKTIKAVLR